MFPTIAEYNQVIQSNSTAIFKSLTNLSFIPSRTAPVKIYSYGAGSYAVVFKAKDQYSEYAIRCFISAEKENIERYQKIGNYLKEISASWITKIELLQNEMNVRGSYYPIIKMDWIEGHLLNNYITQNVDDNLALSELQREVINVSRSLESLRVGHGDIQCGNIIITKNGKGQSVIKLIDYDGMYIPSFSNKTNLERGRPEFQHPSRSQIQYNEKIDRFSFWVILCALEALKYDKTLWFEVMQGGFNTLDNLLFVGDDFKYFNNSKLVNRLYGLKKSALNYYLDKLSKFCNSSPESVEFPTIFDSVKLQTERITAQIFETNNSNGEIEIITTPTGAAVLTSTLERIGITPLKIDKSKYLGKYLIISYGTQFNQIIIEPITNVVNVTFTETLGLVKDKTFPPQPKLTPPHDDSETNKYGLPILGVILVSIVVVMLIWASASKENKFPVAPSTYNSNTTDATSYVDSIPTTADTVALHSPSTNIEVSGTEGDSTILSSTPNTEDENTSNSIKNDNDITADQTAKGFLSALGNQNCDSAWFITYNPSWESKGKKWFCSTEAFGGIRKLILENIYTISKTDNEVEIYVEYYAEDIFNGNYCYKQKIIVNKISIQNSEPGWMIAKIANIEAPSPCRNQ